MAIRYSALALMIIVVGCGGSSRRAGADTGADDGGTAGQATAGSSGGASTLGGSGGTTGGAGAVPNSGGNGATSGVAGDTMQSSGGTAAGGTGGYAGSCGPGGCIAGAAGDVTMQAPPGPVLCGGQECGEKETCCLATGKCFDPAGNADECATPPPDDDLWGRTVCASAVDCAPGWFCMVEGGLCQGTGHCQPIDNCGTCDDGGGGQCRLCACDGNTYANAQAACRAGTFAVTSGAGCGETFVEGGGGRSGSPPNVMVACGKDADCTASGDRCCTLTGRCYPTSDAAQCVEPPPGTRFPCTTNAQCRESEICMGDGCEGPGGCVLADTSDCGVVLSPVCGCDGVTYTSSACALERGTRVASPGECQMK